MTNQATITWSPQQEAFLDWCEKGQGSAVLEAVAGAGKTTTIIEGARRMYGQVAIMAFNKKIAEEIKVKITKAGMTWKKAQGGTAHSFGFSAYRKARPGVEVKDDKVRTIVESAVPVGHHLALFQSAIRQLVSLAKQSAFGIEVSATDEHLWEELAEHYDIFDEDEGPIPAHVKRAVLQKARDVLEESSNMLDVIDFDDMIYMPLLHKCRFWQFDVVMVDEAQDTNAARRALVRAMVKHRGRVIAVGDRHQAIYGFTGADADALDLIAQDFDCVRLPLTVSYRCPQKVVRFARQWVSHIEAAPTAPEGAVSQSSMDHFLARNDLDGSAAVLSRTNKPLVALAFKLIRQRTPCRIEGSDVANRIKKLVTRWKVQSLEALESKLDAYLDRERTKLLAKKRESQLSAVEDTVETVKVIIDQCRSEGKHKLSDVVAWVDVLFTDNATGVLVLSSIHKSKGREWERVFWLDRVGTCPNRWARQAWQQEQEKNLMYVAATRAQAELIDLLPTP